MNVVAFLHLCTGTLLRFSGGAFSLICTIFFEVDKIRGRGVWTALLRRPARYWWASCQPLQRWFHELPNLHLRSWRGGNGIPQLGVQLQPNIVVSQTLPYGPVTLPQNFFQVLPLLGVLQVGVHWKLPLRTARVNRSARASYNAVIREPEFTRKGPSAIQAEPAISSLVVISDSISRALQFELYVDTASDALLYPSREISVHVVQNLVIFAKGGLCTTVHILHATMKVNCKEKGSFRGEHE